MLIAQSDTVKTYGITRNVLKRGLSDEESGMARFSEVVDSEFSGRRARVYFSWNLWLAVK